AGDLLAQHPGHRVAAPAGRTVQPAAPAARAVSAARTAIPFLPVPVPRTRTPLVPPAVRPVVT
ncbi:hypothetical protein AB8O53_25695, partial [Streptomyces pilosus]